MVSDNDSKPSVITGGFVVFNICWNHFSTEVDSLNFRKSLSGIFLPFTTPKTGESPPTNGEGEVANIVFINTYKIRDLDFSRLRSGVSEAEKINSSIRCRRLPILYATPSR